MHTHALQLGQVRGELLLWHRTDHRLPLLLPGSTLILHGTCTELISLVTQTSFTPSLVHIKGHPTAILHHLSVEYLTPPPPLSPEPKFWSVFLPLSQRQKDVNVLVFGSNGEGSGDSNEIVLEMLVRGLAGRKRNVDRELEAWSLARGPCEWRHLETLKSIWAKQAPPEVYSWFGSKTRRVLNQYIFRLPLLPIPRKIFPST